MSEQTLATKYDFLVDLGPRVDLIKKGTYEPKKLTNKSQIVEIPLNSNPEQLQLGFFNMQPGEEFEWTYDSLEVKTVLEGKLVVFDDRGRRLVGEAGDVFIFYPTTTVIFGAESDAKTVLVAHREPDDEMPKPNA